MEIKILTERDFSIGRWSGGTTTQLYIYPEDGDYGKRDFAVRISSADVELEESDFTPLPGITRYITPLTGGFTLAHPGKEPVVMKPLDPPYLFDGGVATHCVGRAADFNLMLKGVDGSMEIGEGEVAPAPLVCIYPIGGGTVKVDNDSYNLSENSLIVIKNGEGHAVFSTSALICKVKI